MSDARKPGESFEAYRERIKQEGRKRTTWRNLHIGNRETKRKAGR